MFRTLLLNKMPQHTLGPEARMQKDSCGEAQSPGLVDPFPMWKAKCSRLIDVSAERPIDHSKIRIRIRASKFRNQKCLITRGFKSNLGSYFVKYNLFPKAKL